MKGLLEMNGIKKVVVAGTVAVIALLGAGAVSGATGAVVADPRICC